MIVKPSKSTSKLLMKENVVPQVASVLLKGLLVQWAPKRVVVRRMTLLSVNARKDFGFASSLKRAGYPVLQPSHRQQ